MISSQEKQALKDLLNIITKLSLPMVLVGAGARLLIFDQQFGEDRSTRDWDVAVSIDSWETYQQLSECLVQGDSPRFLSTKNSHKFRHIETNIEVDIVPFGKIGEPDQEIVWPDSGNPMNVLGFSEALSFAKTTSIDDLEIPVIDTPAFIVLKVFAWGDRGERTKKDLEDIDFILSKYEDYERAYIELQDELAEGVVELVNASIYLLGKDIYKMLQHRTLVELNILLDRLVDSLNCDEPYSLGYRLQVLQAGISSLSSKR